MTADPPDKATLVAHIREAFAGDKLPMGGMGEFAENHEWECEWLLRPRRNKFEQRRFRKREDLSLRELSCNTDVLILLECSAFYYYLPVFMLASLGELKRKKHCDLISLDVTDALYLPTDTSAEPEWWAERRRLFECASDRQGKAILPYLEYWEAVSEDDVDQTLIRQSIRNFWGRFAE